MKLDWHRAIDDFVRQDYASKSTLNELGRFGKWLSENLEKYIER